MATKEDSRKFVPVGRTVTRAALTTLVPTALVSLLVFLLVRRDGVEFPMASPAGIWLWSTLGIGLVMGCVVAFASQTREGVIGVALGLLLGLVGVATVLILTVYIPAGYF